MEYIITNGKENIMAEDETQPEPIKGKQLASGLLVPASVKIPINYLDDLRKYQDVYNDIYKQMAVAWKLYKFNSIIGNAVDVLTDFAVTEIWAEETGNKKLDKLLNKFFEEVNKDNTNTVPGIYPVMQELVLEWFTSGNAFPYVKWDYVEVEGLDGLYRLPTSINLLNPQAITLPSAPLAFGQEVIYLKIDADLLSLIRADGRSSPEAALIKQAIPRSIINSLKDKPRSFFETGIRLNPKFVSHLKRKGKGYYAWGTPYLSRCFSSGTLLERLRELDDSITTGLINLITIFKVGTEERPASAARLQKLARLLSNPTPTKTLVWAHDIDVLQVGPDGKVLAFKDKYKDAKEDLLIGLGIPPVLMSLSQQGNEWVAILALVEKLANWRKTTSLWLEGICNQISEQNGFKEKVRTKWDIMNLKDESNIKNLILAFYDRGLISIKTALQQSGYDIETEKSRKEIEQNQLDLFVPPKLPFSGKDESGKSKQNESDIKSNIKKSMVNTENTINLDIEKKKLTKNKKEPKVR